MGYSGGRDQVHRGHQLVFSDIIFGLFWLFGAYLAIFLGQDDFQKTVCGSNHEAK